MLGEKLKYLQLFIFELQQNNNIDVFPFFRNFFVFFFSTIFKSTRNFLLLSLPKVQTRYSFLPETTYKNED